MNFEHTVGTFQTKTKHSLFVKIHQIKMMYCHCTFCRYKIHTYYDYQVYFFLHLLLIFQVFLSSSQVSSEKNKVLDHCSISTEQYLRPTQVPSRTCNKEKKNISKRKLGPPKSVNKKTNKQTQKPTSSQRPKFPAYPQWFLIKPTIVAPCRQFITSVSR